MMEYLISAGASVWLMAFIFVERRVGGRTGYLWRLVGTAPLLVVAVLAWRGRFSYDALMIGVVFVVVVSIVGLAVDELGKRRSTEHPG